MKKLSQVLFPFFSFLLSAILVSGHPAGVCRAGEIKERCFQGVEFLTGFGAGSLDSKQDYHIIPFFVDFDFDLKPLTKKAGFNPPGLLQFQIEPFLSLVSRPDTNFETGSSFFIKMGILPERFNLKVQPYIKAGWGMVYMSQHTLEQSTQFNFITHLGVGAHYSLTKNTALTLEYRFRHLSNASIKHPNSGINNHFAVLGVSYLF